MNPRPLNPPLNKPLTLNPNLRRAAALDPFLFGDANFIALPSEGEVQPGGEFEVVIQFSPDYSREYETIAYVDVQVPQPSPNP